jgi:rhodanese-related sulfurtransferase
MTGEATAEASIVARAQAILADWAPVTPATALFDNLSDGDEYNDPFILSVRAEDAYALGHIKGAANLGWKAVATPDAMDSLPTDQPILVYCYTGHTGQVAAIVLALMVTTSAT